MTDPKTFYRKFDSLLSKIGMEKSGKDFLFSIAKELELTFGPDIKIGRGRIYEKSGGEYVLISGKETNSGIKATERFSVESEPVQALLNSRTYIFDNRSFTIDPLLSSNGDYTVPAAITVNNSLNYWIFIFELSSGWIREEVEFCLNAVRTALNYRLISESIKSEMQQAVHIQQSLLPAAPPSVPGYLIAARSIPAELVGGDLYDYYKLDGEVFGICLGDASGHGIPAALVVRDVVTGLRMGLEKHMKMVHTLKKLNKVIYQSVYSTRFISLFFAEVETNGNLFYVNAGHPAPFIIQGNKVIDLESTGTVFGAIPEIELYRSYARLETGSVLVIFSDGIIERADKKEEQFGLERLKNAALDFKDKSPDEILDAIFAAAYKFGGGKRWEDDATCMVIKRVE